MNFESLMDNLTFGAFILDILIILCVLVGAIVYLLFVFPLGHTKAYQLFRIVLTPVHMFTEMVGFIWFRIIWWTVSTPWRIRRQRLFYEEFTRPPVARTHKDFPKVLNCVLTRLGYLAREAKHPERGKWAEERFKYSVDLAWKNDIKPSKNIKDHQK